MPRLSEADGELKPLQAKRIASPAVTGEENPPPVVLCTNDGVRNPLEPCSITAASVGEALTMVWVSVKLLAVFVQGM